MCRLKPLRFPFLFLRPIVVLVFKPEQKNADLAEDCLFGQPFLVVVRTERSLADNMTDQASLFVCLLARYLGWCPPFHWPTFGDNPTAGLARCQQQNLACPALAYAPRERSELSSAVRLRHPQPT